MVNQVQLQGGRSVEIEVKEQGDCVIVSQLFRDSAGAKTKTCTVTCSGGKSFTWQCSDKQDCFGDCTDPNNPKGSCV